MTLHVNTAFHSSTSDDFNPSIAAADRADNRHTQVTLSWAYTDTASNVPTADAYAFSSGALPHVTGSAFSPAGHITGETRFGDYSSVWPEYDARAPARSARTRSSRTSTSTPTAAGRPGSPGSTRPARSTEGRAVHAVAGSALYARASFAPALRRSAATAASRSSALNGFARSGSSRPPREIACSA
jgi:hypothetical protein